MGEACSIYVNQHVGRPPIEQPAPGWYAVQTGYRCEQRVLGDLLTKGFETYLPMLREVHQWKDRRKQMDVPAFGGYLFVRFEASVHNRVRVLETGGVVKLLGSNHAPIEIAESEIDDLRRTLSSGISCSRCETLVPGALVRVRSGPLAGVQGRLVRIKNNLRLVIAIAAISRAVSAELGLEDVETIPDMATAEIQQQRLSA